MWVYLCTQQPFCISCPQLEIIKGTPTYNKDFLIERRNMIQNENYITIQGWMVNELNLKGNALIVYAIIYGFSQSGDCEFTGSASYLADWCGCSRQTIMTTLNKLVSDEMIIKKEEFRNNVKFCSYRSEERR